MKCLRTYKMSSGKEIREEAFTLPQQLVFKSGLNDQEWNELSRLSMKVFNNLSK